jgi:protein gp37
MGSDSKIEWTEATWNPVTGCSKISAGCQNCYAERMAKRLRAMGQPNYRDGFKVTVHEETLALPLSWKKPRLIFVNSMSDLFHKEVPLPFILKVFDIMHKANWHHYQVLTKRSERLLELDPKLKWAPHIWMGVTVEDDVNKRRIRDLQETHAHVKFISLEPLIAPMNNLPLEGIGWAIVGGESGPGARPMEPAWVLSIRDQCAHAQVPFFFKQWGGVNKKKTGHLLEGQTYDAMPQLKGVADSCKILDQFGPEYAPTTPPKGERYDH